MLRNTEIGVRFHCLDFLEETGAEKSNQKFALFSLRYGCFLINIIICSRNKEEKRKKKK
jgi:hypothetical protein